MAKVTLSDITNLENQSSSQSTINSNNDAIETAMENTLSRDGTSPNAMGADLDMDSNRILNLPAPTTAGEPLRKGDQFTSTEAQSFASDAETAKDAAESALATFQGIFLGSYSSDPATDPNGDAINEGDFYYDTTNNVVKFYNGSSFVVSESNPFFINVSDNVTASHTEINTLDGITSSTTDLNSISGHNSALDTLLNNFSEDRVALGGQFDAGQEVVCSRIGNLVTITSDGVLSHSNDYVVSSASGAIPAAYRPQGVIFSVYYQDNSAVYTVNVDWNGMVQTLYRDNTGSVISFPVTRTAFTISYVIASNIT